MAPMLPQPMTPSTLPVSSTPMKRLFSQRPLRVERSAAGICRATAKSRAMACSAVVMELPPGVFMTTMPRPVAAGRSTLSTPMPARPTTRSRGAAAIRSSVTLVAERTIRPSASATLAARASPVRPGSSSTARPRSRSNSAAIGLTLSAMKTFGALRFMLRRPPRPWCCDRPSRARAAGLLDLRSRPSPRPRGGSRAARRGRRRGRSRRLHAPRRRPRPW